MLFIIFINVLLAFDNDEHHLNLNADSDCRISEIFTTNLITNTRICLVQCQFKNIGSKTSQQSALYIGNSNEPNIINIIESCIFQNCSSQNGGAVFIYCKYQSFTNITNCVF